LPAALWSQSAMLPASIMHVAGLSPQQSSSDLKQLHSSASNCTGSRALQHCQYGGCASHEGGRANSCNRDGSHALLLQLLLLLLLLLHSVRRHATASGLVGHHALSLLHKPITCSSSSSSGNTQAWISSDARA
jgi:hypothetical protein